jgi:hypothetical protein
MELSKTVSISTAVQRNGPKRGRLTSLLFVELETEAAGATLEMRSGKVHGAGVAARDAVTVSGCNRTDLLDSSSGTCLEMGSGKVQGAGWAAREGNALEDVDDGIAGSSEAMLAGMAGTTRTAEDVAARAAMARLKLERIFCTSVIIR